MQTEDSFYTEMIFPNPLVEGQPATETVFVCSSLGGTKERFIRNRLQGCIGREEAKELADLEERLSHDRQEREEFRVAYDALTLSEQLVLEDLNKIIEDLETAGVDISYFPHSARMVLIEWARLIDAKVITWTEDRGD